MARFVRDISERISDTAPILADILVFNTCLFNCELKDLPSSACELSWTNKQETRTSVWSKLDRALGNSSWLTMYPASSANFLALGASDLSLVVVTEAWHLSVSGSNTFKRFKKLKNVKKALRKLHEENYNGITKKLITLKQELQNCQQELQSQPLSAALFAKEK
ncbi:uncharacterized protein LOC141589928 [Silene latifolia]|uniref:uncharacterized protein LOC141589928 n=1 Tax=Silene latifolia TaxID=37657 RepID=UPI003D772284